MFEETPNTDFYYLCEFFLKHYKDNIQNNPSNKELFWRNMEDAFNKSGLFVKHKEKLISLGVNPYDNLLHPINSKNKYAKLLSIDIFKIFLISKKEFINLKHKDGFCYDKKGRLSFQTNKNPNPDFYYEYEHEGGWSFKLEQKYYIEIIDYLRENSKEFAQKLTNCDFSGLLASMPIRDRGYDNLIKNVPEEEKGYLAHFKETCANFSKHFDDIYKDKELLDDLNYNISHFYEYKQWWYNQINNLDTRISNNTNLIYRNGLEVWDRSIDDVDIGYCTKYNIFDCFFIKNEDIAKMTLNDYCGSDYYRQCDWDSIEKYNHIGHDIYVKSNYYSYRMNYWFIEGIFEYLYCNNKNFRKWWNNSAYLPDALMNTYYGDYKKNRLEEWMNNRKLHINNEKHTKNQKTQNLKK